MLTKGLPVEYRIVVYNQRHDDEGQWRRFFNDKKVTYAVKNDPENGRLICVEAFVPNDTEEKGVSLLALSNTKVCLFTSGTRPDNMKACRELMLRGYFLSTEPKTCSVFTMESPKCPYNS